MRTFVLPATMTAQPQRSLSSRPEHGKPWVLFQLACIASVIGALPVGCAVAPKLPAPEHYILAARYDMGIKQSAQSPQTSLELDQNLQRLKSIGFNTVLFDYLEDTRRFEALDAAARVGLRSYLTDRDLHYYLLTGKLRGADSLETLIATKLKPLTSRASYAGVAILSGYPRERASAVASALRLAGMNCLIPGQSGYSTNGGSMVAWLDANDLTAAPTSQIERLLLELNSEIYAGWNDGLVIDWEPASEIANSSLIRLGGTDRNNASSSPAPLKGEGLGQGRDHAPPTASEVEPEPTPPDGSSLAPTARSRMFAVESLLRRASLWGARLKGFDRQPVPPDGLRRDPAVLSVAFARDARRYLFLFNQSSQPVRGPVRFPANLAGRPVVRAVGIPAIADRIAGDVFIAHGTELSVNINLRPGDAALFELF